MDRSILLPEFLQTDAWLEFSKSIDKLMSDVDKKTRLLSRIREPSQFSYSGMLKVLNKKMLSQADLNHFDREFLVRSLNLIGLPFDNTEVFSDAHLFRFLQSLARFWYSKGKSDVAEFLSFVLNADLKIVNMWTEDYITFLPEGDPDIRVPLMNGGTWYPTTHIQLTYDPTALKGVSIKDVVTMVYEMGNYNLVFHSIVAESRLPVVQDSDNVTDIFDFESSKSIALAQVTVVEVTISN